MNELHFFGIHIFYYLIVVAFLLPRIPIIGKFFNIINTLIHELGHAIVAAVLQGQILKIQVFSDTSGVTVTQSKSKVAAFFVALAGYPFAALAGVVCTYLLSLDYAAGIVYGLSILFLFMLILWVRNVYGAVWVLSFVALNGVLVFYFQNDLYIEIAAWFYTITIIIESIWSPLILLYLSIFQADKAGDATLLRSFTRIPAFFWALLFVAISGWCAYQAVGYVGNLISLTDSIVCNHTFESFL